MQKLLTLLLTALLALCTASLASAQAIAVPNKPPASPYTPIPDETPTYSAQEIADLENHAQQGSAQAQLTLGNIYRMGTGVKPDGAKALALYTQAAEQGYAPALYELGVMYDTGQGGTRQDLKKALALYIQSAEQGYVPAMLWLGLVYQIGKGAAPQNYTQSRQWYEKAAAQGEGKGYYALALLYEYGSGVPKDSDIARQYFRKGCDAGHQDSCYVYQRLPAPQHPLEPTTTIN